MFCGRKVLRSKNCAYICGHIQIHDRCVKCINAKKHLEHQRNQAKNKENETLETGLPDSSEDIHGIKEEIKAIHPENMYGKDEEQMQTDLKVKQEDGTVLCVQLHEDCKVCEHLYI